MMDDQLVIEMAEALAGVARVFQKHGMKPPKAIILGDVDDGHRMKGLRLSYVMPPARPVDWPPELVCKIRGFDFLMPQD